MLYEFESLDHQFHCPCVAISAEGLTRPIVLVRAGDGWRVMQRRAFGGLPPPRGSGPLDALHMHEIAGRALRERGLDPRLASWVEIRAQAKAPDYLRSAATGS